MRKTVEKEIRICDMCGKEDVYFECLGCGKTLCYDCEKTGGERFQQAVAFSGSDDGMFCNACISNPSEEIVELLEGYVVIKNLIAEQRVWYSEYRERAERAKDRAGRLFKERLEVLRKRGYGKKLTA